MSAAGSAGFDLDGGNATITFDGTIAASASARPVEVTNRTGATVDFNGTVSGTGQGVNLTGNTGATVRFDGGLTLSTGGNTAFNATGGGTVVVTDPNANGTAPDNALTTTTGTALIVTSTNIGANGLTFRSISANGAANGVVLTATGNSGGLTVTGDGTGAANASGGLIQNTTQAGVLVDGSRDLSLSQLNVNTTGTAATAVGHGIQVSNVTNFTFQDGSVLNAGVENEESSMKLLNLLGTSLIEDVVLNGINEDGIEVRQTSSTAGSLTIRRLDVQAHNPGFGEAGIEVQTDLASNLTMLVDDSDFAINTNAVIGLAASTAASFTGTFSLTAQANVFNAANAFGSGSLQVLGGGHGNQTYVIQNNTINNTKFDGIRVNTDFGGTAGGPTTTRATIQNNTIDGTGNTPGAVNNGEGITLRDDGGAGAANPGDAILFARIANNNITDFKSNQIHVQGSDGSTNASDAQLDDHREHRHHSRRIRRLRRGPVDRCWGRLRRSEERGLCQHLRQQPPRHEHGGVLRLRHHAPAERGRWRRRRQAEDRAGITGSPHRREQRRDRERLRLQPSRAGEPDRLQRARLHPAVTRRLDTCLTCRRTWSPNASTG